MLASKPWQVDHQAAPSTCLVLTALRPAHESWPPGGGSPQGGRRGHRCCFHERPPVTGSETDRDDVGHCPVSTRGPRHTVGSRIPPTRGESGPTDWLSATASPTGGRGRIPLTSQNSKQPHLRVCAEPGHGRPHRDGAGQ